MAGKRTGFTGSDEYKAEAPLNRVGVRPENAANIPDVIRNPRLFIV
jgi:hypothetical protein